MTTLGIENTAKSAANYLNTSNKKLSDSIRLLASGSRLADPSADAAGVAVSGDLQARLSRLQAANNDTGDTVSLAQTTDGFLSTIQDQLSRLGSLALSASDGALGTAASSDYSAEFNNILNQVSLIASGANFDGVGLFSGQSIPTAVNGDGATTSLQLSTLGSAASLGLSGASIATPASALQALSLVNVALTQVTNRRAEVGADISALNFYSSNIQTEAINTSTANSRIADVDVASASTQAATANIQNQAATSVLAQANTHRRYVLALLSPISSN
jgi:flagellin